jgi:hypothetical protein
VLTGVEMFRVNAGAGANTLETPKEVTAYEPSAADLGGWFDDRSRADRFRKRS